MPAVPDIAVTLPGRVIRLGPGDDPPADAGDGTVLAAAGTAQGPPGWVESLVAAAAAGATVVLRVPVLPLTGAGALEELRGLLPADHVHWREVPLRGAAVVRGGDGPIALDAVLVGDEPPSHAVLVFGPQAGAATPVAAVGPADLEAERQELARLRSDLEVARASPPAVS